MSKVFAIQVSQSDMDATEVLLCCGNDEKHFVEPKQGEWVDENKGTVFYKSTCSICGWNCHGVSLNFCPNCGADMRVKTDFN